MLLYVPKHFTFSYSKVIVVILKGMLTSRSPLTQCQGSRSWWANCAWCALGLAAMLAPLESTVNFLLRSSGQHCAINVVGGELEKSTESYFITFSPPPSRWWDDVKFACSTIQVCESRQVADMWFSQHGFTRGEVLELDTVWKLSKVRSPVCVDFPWVGNFDCFDQCEITNWYSLI